MYQITLLSGEEILFLVGPVLIMLTLVCVVALLHRNRLTAFWMKLSLPSTRGSLIYGLAFAGFAANLLQDEDALGGVLLRVLGVVVVGAIIALVVGAAFGSRSIGTYAEQGAPGAGGMNWGLAILIFLVILGVVGPMVAVPTKLFSSWPVKFGENIWLSFCGSLCK